MPPLRNLIAGSLMLALAGYGGLKAYLYHDARHRIALAFAPFAAVGEVKYDAISVSLFGPVSLHGLQVTPREGEPFTVGRFVLQELEQGSRGTPFFSRVAVRLEDVQLSAWAVDRWLREIELPPGAGLPEDLVLPDLRSLGYTTLSGDLGLELRFEPTAGVFEMGLDLSCAELAGLSLDMAFADYDPLLAMQGALVGKFRSFTMDYRDRSLVPRLYAWAAKQRQVEQEALRDALLADLTEEKIEPALNLGAENIEQLRRFVAEPRRLVLRMEPFEAVPLAEVGFYSERDLPLLFNLQLKSGGN